MSRNLPKYIYLDKSNNTYRVIIYYKGKTIEGGRYKSVVEATKKRNDLLRSANIPFRNKAEIRLQLEKILKEIRKLSYYSDTIPTSHYERLKTVINCINNLKKLY